MGVHPFLGEAPDDVLGAEATRHQPGGQAVDPLGQVATGDGGAHGRIDEGGSLGSREADRRAAGPPRAKQHLSWSVRREQQSASPAGPLQ